MVAGDEDHLDRADRRADAPRAPGGPSPSAAPSGRSRSSTTSPRRTRRSAPRSSSSRTARVAGSRSTSLPPRRAEVEVGDDRRLHPVRPSTGRWSADQARLAGWPAALATLPRMYSFGEERMAPANGIELCYQEMGDPDGMPLLLVMGLATQMIAWHEGFCSLLADRGYRVIRFDNRDIGRSTKIGEAGVPSKVDLLLGRRVHRALPAARHGQGLGRPARLPGDRPGPHRRRLDGRDDRPADGDRPSAPGPLDGLDHVDHRQPPQRPAEPQNLRRPARQPAEDARPGDQPRGQDLQGDRLARLPLRRRHGARDGGPLLRPRPLGGRGDAASCTRSSPPATGPRACARSRPRPPSSTAPATRWSNRPAAAPPRRRSPARA